MSSHHESPLYDTTFEDGREWTIHTRNLGTKQGHVYPTIEWSDVVINETYFEMKVPFVLLSNNQM